MGVTLQHLGSSLSRQQFSAITQQLFIPSHTSSGKYPALSQLNECLAINVHTYFLSFLAFLSFDIKSNFRWDFDRAFRYLYNSLESDEFPKFLKLESNLIYKMDRTVLSSMVHIHFVHSWYMHSGFISELSDYKHLRDGLTIIQDSLPVPGLKFADLFVRYTYLEFIGKVLHSTRRTVSSSCLVKTMERGFLCRKCFSPISSQGC